MTPQRPDASDPAATTRVIPPTGATVVPGATVAAETVDEVAAPDVVILEDPRPVVAPAPVTVRPVTAVRDRGVHPVWIAVALLAVVVLGAVLAALLWPRPAEPSPAPTVVTVPGQPGPTVTVPGPAVAVPQPGPTVTEAGPTVTQPGPTVTQQQDTVVVVPDGGGTG